MCVLCDASVGYFLKFATLFKLTLAIQGQKIQVQWTYQPAMELSVLFMVKFFTNHSIMAKGDFLTNPKKQKQIFTENTNT